jgi:hypothetical protein
MWIAIRLNPVLELKLMPLMFQSLYFELSASKLLYRRSLVYWQRNHKCSTCQSTNEQGLCTRYSVMAAHHQQHLQHKHRHRHQLLRKGQHVFENHALLKLKENDSLICSPWRWETSYALQAQKASSTVFHVFLPSCTTAKFWKVNIYRSTPKHQLFP